MFNLSFPTILLLVFAGVITFAALRLQTPLAERLRPHLILLWGFMLTLGGLFFQPWIKFDPLIYVMPEWSPMEGRDTLEFAQTLVKHFGFKQFAGAVEILLRVTNLNVLSLELVPTLGLWARLWSLLPIALMSLTFLAILIGLWVQPPQIRRVIFGGLGGLLLLNIFGLLLSLPAIDALTRATDIAMGMIFALLGAQLSNGAWITLLGLCISAVGCLAAVTPAQPFSNNSDTYQEAAFNVDF